MNHGAQQVTRDAVIDLLVERRRLWPLLPYNTCRLCASPRAPERAKSWPTCYGCKQLRDLYGDALADVFPLSITTPEWPAGSSLREFKDRYQARVDTRFALGFGAVLSAWLEAQLAARRLGLAWDFGVITTVPSSKPVIVNVLARAALEGWWAPRIQHVASGREGVQRQRERAGNERFRVENKWDVDGAAVLGQDVLVLDDLYTTGGSLHSLAAALRKGGAQTVTGAVIARNIGADGGWVLPMLVERHEAGIRWDPAQNKYDLPR